MILLAIRYRRFAGQSLQPTQATGFKCTGYSFETPNECMFHYCSVVEPSMTVLLSPTRRFKEGMPTASAVVPRASSAALGQQSPEPPRHDRHVADTGVACGLRGKYAVTFYADRQCLQGSQDVSSSKSRTARASCPPPARFFWLRASVTFRPLPGNPSSFVLVITVRSMRLNRTVVVAR